MKDSASYTPRNSTLFYYFLVIDSRLLAQSLRLIDYFVNTKQPI